MFILNKKQNKELILCQLIENQDGHSKSLSKKQMLELHQSGKSRKDILREYDLTPSSFDKWVKQYNQSGSFKEKENLTS